MRWPRSPARCGARLAVVGDPSRYGALKEQLAGQRHRGRGRRTGAGGGGAAAGRMGDGRHRRRRRPARRPWRRCGAAPWWRSPTRNAWSAPATCSCARSPAPRRDAAAGRFRAQRDLPGPGRANDQAGVRRLILTASGGPFRTGARRRWRAPRPPQAVAHPNWSMGAKISVDSATMMNKGLEIIEAHHLFAMPGSCDRGRGPSRSRSCTAWSPSATARCWRSWASPTCASRSPAPWAGPAGSSPRAPELDLCARSGLRVRAARCRALPRLAARAARLAAGWCGTYSIERRQRGGGDGVPGGSDRLSRHRAYRGGAVLDRVPSQPVVMISRPFLPTTPRRAG